MANEQDTAPEAETTEVTETEGANRDSAERVAERAQLTRVTEALTGRYEVPRDWRDREFIAFGEGSQVEDRRTGKMRPFTNTPTGRTNGRPSLFVDVDEVVRTQDLEKSVRHCGQAGGALFSRVKARAVEMGQLGQGKDAEGRLATAWAEVSEGKILKPCVPLFRVLGALEHQHRMKTDTVYARSVAEMDEVVECDGRVSDDCDKQPTQTRLGDMRTLNVRVLHGIKRNPAGNSAKVVEIVSSLLGLHQEVQEKRGRDAFARICRKCADQLVDSGLAPWALKSARVVREYAIRESDEAAGEAAEADETIARLQKRGITLKADTSSPQFQRDVYDNRGGRGGGRGDRFNDRDRGRRDGGRGTHDRGGRDNERGGWRR